MAEGLLITGKRGSGKTLTTMFLVQEKLEAGLPVATNLDLFPDNFLPSWNKSLIIRLPDIPSPADLESLPIANASYDEEKNGLIVLDECVKFLGAREWNKGDRTGLMSYFVETRKMGWDLAFLCQSPKMIDNQIREGLTDLHVQCRRPKVPIPIITFLSFWLFSKKLYFPRFHIAVFRLGFSADSPIEHWRAFRGGDLYKGYDTKQRINIFCKDNNSKAEFGCAPATILPPYYTTGRYLGIFKMYGKIAFSMFVFGAIASAISILGYEAFIKSKQPEQIVQTTTQQPNQTTTAQINPEQTPEFTVTGVIKLGATYIVTTSDGKQYRTNTTKREGLTTYYLINNLWIPKYV